MPPTLIERPRTTPYDRPRRHHRRTSSHGQTHRRTSSDPALFLGSTVAQATRPAATEIDHSHWETPAKLRFKTFYALQPGRKDPNAPSVYVKNLQRDDCEEKRGAKRSRSISSVGELQEWDDGGVAYFPPAQNEPKLEESDWWAEHEQPQFERVDPAGVCLQPPSPYSPHTSSPSLSPTVPPLFTQNLTASPEPIWQPGEFSDEVEAEGEEDAEGKTQGDDGDNAEGEADEDGDGEEEPEKSWLYHLTCSHENASAHLRQLLTERRKTQQIYGPSSAFDQLNTESVSPVEPRRPLRTLPPPPSTLAETYVQLQRMLQRPFPRRSDFESRLQHARALHGSVPSLSRVCPNCASHEPQMALTLRMLDARLRDLQEKLRATHRQIVLNSWKPEIVWAEEKASIPPMPPMPSDSGTQPPPKKRKATSTKAKTEQIAGGHKSKERLDDFASASVPHTSRVNDTGAVASSSKGASTMPPPVTQQAQRGAQAQPGQIMITAPPADTLIVRSDNPSSNNNGIVPSKSSKRHKPKPKSKGKPKPKPQPIKPFRDSEIDPCLRSQEPDAMWNPAQPVGVDTTAQALREAHRRMAAPTDSGAQLYTGPSASAPPALSYQTQSQPQPQLPQAQYQQPPQAQPQAQAHPMSAQIQQAMLQIRQQDSQRELGLGRPVKRRRFETTESSQEVAEYFAPDSMGSMNSVEAQLQPSFASSSSHPSSLYQQPTQQTYQPQPQPQPQPGQPEPSQQQGYQPQQYQQAYQHEDPSPAGPQVGVWTRSLPPSLRQAVQQDLLQARREREQRLHAMAHKEMAEMFQRQQQALFGNSRPAQGYAEQQALALIAQQTQAPTPPMHHPTPAYPSCAPTAMPTPMPSSRQPRPVSHHAPVNAQHLDSAVNSRQLTPLPPTRQRTPTQNGQSQETTGHSFMDYAQSLPQTSEQREYLEKWVPLVQAWPQVQAQASQQQQTAPQLPQARSQPQQVMPQALPQPTPSQWQPQPPPQLSQLPQPAPQLSQQVPVQQPQQTPQPQPQPERERTLTEEEMQQIMAFLNGNPELLRPAQPAESAQPAQPAQPSQPSQPSQPDRATRAQPAQSAHLAQSSQSAQPAQTGQSYFESTLLSLFDAIPPQALAQQQVQQTLPPAQQAQPQQQVQYQQNSLGLSAQQTSPHTQTPQTYTPQPQVRTPHISQPLAQTPMPYTPQAYTTGLTAQAPVYAPSPLSAPPTMPPLSQPTPLAHPLTQATPLAQPPLTHPTPLTQPTPFTQPPISHPAPPPPASASATAPPPVLEHTPSGRRVRAYLTTGSEQNRELVFDVPAHMCDADALGWASVMAAFGDGLSTTVTLPSSAAPLPQTASPRAVAEKNSSNKRKRKEEQEEEAEEQDDEEGEEEDEEGDEEDEEDEDEEGEDEEDAEGEEDEDEDAEGEEDEDAEGSDDDAEGSDEE